MSWLQFRMWYINCIIICFRAVYDIYCSYLLRSGWIRGIQNVFWTFTITLYNYDPYSGELMLAPGIQVCSFQKDPFISKKDKTVNVWNARPPSQSPVNVKLYIVSAHNILLLCVLKFTLKVTPATSSFSTLTFTGCVSLLTHNPAGHISQQLPLNCHTAHLKSS
jgi:hypothetical protein